MIPSLDSFPRVALGQWPSPLEDASRLTAALGGPRVLLKRDDLCGVGAGGNKLRKLEFLLGRALADGADTVITFGALQTNHGRETAAACARVGLRCELVLTAKVPRDGDAYRRSGNMLLDRLFGAKVHICEDAAHADSVHRELLAEAAAQGRKVFGIPLGGSNDIGLLGYVAAAGELIGQLAERGIDRARVVIPFGTGGTVAGFAVGAAALGWPGIVDAACVVNPAEESARTLHRLAGEVTRLLGLPSPELDHVLVDDAFRGPRYGVPTEAAWAALRLFGRTEGVALDPVYTGKAAAAMAHSIGRGEIGPGEQVVFLHTGGLPGLFGYLPEADAAFR